ncbi:MAG: carboxypeptidase-like regulatory domain-containing protein [Bacteroidota bacterium]
MTVFFKFVTTAILLFSCSLLHAQNTIFVFGKVSDNNGESLPNALVYTSQQQNTVSNIAGYYQLDTDRQDSISLGVQFIGYQSIDTTIATEDFDTIQINFQLSPTTFDFPEVTVRANEQNLFDRSDWVIVDYVIWAEKMALLLYARWAIARAATTQ